MQQEQPMSQGARHVPNRWSDILRHLQSSRFRDVAGTRLAGTVQLAEHLVNELLAASLPPEAPVRSVTLHPETSGRFSLRIVPKAAFIPGITLKLAIEEQPRLPESAVLVIRMATLSGLFGLASGAVGGMLPPGVKLDGDRILVDLRAIAAQRGLAHLLDHLVQLAVTTDEGRLVLHFDAAVG
jgi:hypothetical protein